MSKEFLKVKLHYKQISKLRWIIDNEKSLQTNQKKYYLLVEFRKLMDEFEKIPFPEIEVKFSVYQIKKLKKKFPVVYKKFIHIVFSDNFKK